MCSSVIFLFSSDLYKLLIVIMLEVYNVICNRLGPTANIPGESVQMLFNDMNLYPSKSQVSEMLQCARQCSRRNGSPFLTFGEFCLFARELKRPEIYRKSKQQHKQNDVSSKNCEVFLGGSCNPTTWRTDIAIPELQKYGISYYNPQKPFWSPELVSEEHDAKQSASVLLYVVESQTRNVVGMMEVAYLMASDRCVVLVIYPYQFGQSIMGEQLSNREYVDLVEGQTTLIALVKSQGVRVHENLSSALQHTASLLRNSSCNGMSAEAMVTYKLRRLREIFDSYDNNNKEELTLNDTMDAFQRLTNKRLKASDLYSYLNIRNSTDPTKFRISFEHFCAIVAEFSSSGGCSTNGFIYDWTHNILNRQCSPPSSNSPHSNPSHNNNSSVLKGAPTWESNYLVDVCLGGSFRTQHSWREQVAIPLLKKHGLTYYNPTVRETSHNSRDLGGEKENVFANGGKYESSVSESDILEWVRVMNRSKVLLFVITNDTKSLSSMILAAHYVGLGRDVVLCIQQLPQQECRLGNETITDQAVKDYNRGRVYLRDFAKRKQLPVFENITEAVQFTIEKCQSR